MDLFSFTLSSPVRYIGKADSITISVWNHKKIHKKQGAGFLGCVRLLSNAINRLKDTGCKYPFVCAEVCSLCLLTHWKQVTGVCSVCMPHSGLTLRYQSGLLVKGEREAKQWLGEACETANLFSHMYAHISCTHSQTGKCGEPGWLSFLSFPVFACFIWLQQLDS